MVNDFGVGKFITPKDFKGKDLPEILKLMQSFIYILKIIQFAKENTQIREQMKVTVKIDQFEALANLYKYFKIDILEAAKQAMIEATANKAVPSPE